MITITFSAGGRAGRGGQEGGGRGRRRLPCCRRFIRRRNRRRSRYVGGRRNGDLGRDKGRARRRHIGRDARSRRLHDGRGRRPGTRSRRVRRAHRAVLFFVRRELGRDGLAVQVREAPPQRVRIAARDTGLVEQIEEAQRRRRRRGADVRVEALRLDVG